MIDQDQPDLYMYTSFCSTIDELKDELSYWANSNKDKIFKSHSVCAEGRSYLLTIVYEYVQYD